MGFVSVEFLALGGFVLLAFGIFWLWGRKDSQVQMQHALVVERTEELSEDAIPGSIHPKINTDVCIGSGACVRACPENHVIGLVGGKATLIGPLACIGHGACAKACPVGAIQLVFGTEKRGLELPMMDANFQTEMPGLYVIGELGGMGLIRNAVNQGAQAAQHAVASGRKAGGAVRDAIVVGAGPAGISAALGLMQGGLNVQLIDQDRFGGTILNYPRNKVTMTGSLHFPVYGKVSKRTMSKEQLLELWNDIQKKTHLSALTQTRIDSISRDARTGIFTLSSTKGIFQAANVLLAVGRRGSPNRLGVPGEDLPKVHYRLLEPEVFRGKHVLVVGGGNSAVENALSLMDNGHCASVAISYRRQVFARCRADNRKRIDDAIATGRIHAVLPSEVVEIKQDRVVLMVNGERKSFKNDDVIIQIGGTEPRELLKQCGIRMVTKYGEA